MEKQQKYVLTPIAGAVAAALSPSQQAVAQDNSAALEEIVVTATKRAVGVQEIPTSIQAITQESLEAMGAKNMEDYARFIPSVNVVNYGSGSSTVVFRGAITGSSYIAQATSSVYLDEISLTTVGDQPQIRMVDIERVEALSGPQGTIFGSDSQAGTMRVVTNKPVLNDFGAAVDLELRGGQKSDESYRGSLVFNLPLVDDRLALRVVGYSDHDGGYIDNVFGHTPDASALDGIDYPAGWGVLDNLSSVENRWNDADIVGGRLALLWQLNDSWSMDLLAVGQSTEAGADNDYDPFVGDLKTSRFHDEWSKDDYEMYSFVLKGDLGFADLVASANYYERNVEVLSDITVYAKYWAATYCHDTLYTTVYDPERPYYYAPYYWANPETGYVVWYPVYCGGSTVDGDWFSSYYEPYNQDKTTFEIRLSHQGETLDWLVGFYSEESNDNWKAPFATPTAGGDGNTNLYQDSISAEYMEWYFTQYYDDGTYYTYPEATSWWYSQSETDWSQDALFGEMTWHINEKIDLTVGGRYFDRSNVNYYIVDHPGDVDLNGEPDTADPDSRQYRLNNDNAPPPRADDEQEFIPKVALSYTTDNNNMVYGLYTQGTRPGGVNRSRGEPFFPTSYTSDLMDNYELGWRSMYADGQGRFNVTAYHMVWTDYQLQLTDPSDQSCFTAGVPGAEEGDGSQVAGLCGQPWQSIVANAGEAHITGINFELDYAFNDNWIFGANIAFMEAETDTTADLTGNGEDDLTAGLRLPLSPEAKGAAWLDYVTPTQWLGSEETFMRFQVSHTGDSVNKLDPEGEDTANPQLTNPAYAIADFRVGIRGSSWELSLFVNNITDERAVYTYGTGQMNWAASSVQDGRDHFLKAYTNRPREAGVRFAMAWGDGT